MNFASSDMRSGVHGGSNDELELDVLDALHFTRGAVDVACDERAGGAAHRREAVGDLHLRAVHLDVVQEPEVDDVHPELGVLHLAQDLENFVLAWHGGQSTYDARVPVVASTGVMNGVLLASAIVPPAIVIVLAWFFLRAGKRHDEREAKSGKP